MKESLIDALEELKRIDHLIYVTLKYTRTVDVLLSVIDRMVNSYSFIVDSLIEKAKSEGKPEVEDVPNIPLAKAQACLKIYDSATIKKHIQRYLLFRKLMRAEYGKSSEFRRHVQFTAVVDEKTIEVNIDSVTEDFHKMKKFLEYVKNNYLVE